ncbi:hypothetical protein NXS19_005058 [Fusarium pseudograminearum]|nr:hypothetical protein NXS19_005058 [Fusarium pseudograminearum]
MFDIVACIATLSTVTNRQLIEPSWTGSLSDYEIKQHTDTSRAISSIPEVMMRMHFTYIALLHGSSITAKKSAM